MSSQFRQGQSFEKPTMDILLFFFPPGLLRLHNQTKQNVMNLYTYIWFGFRLDESCQVSGACSFFAG